MNVRLTLASLAIVTLVTNALHAQQPVPQPYPPQPQPYPYPYPPQPPQQPQQPYPYPPQPYPQPKQQQPQPQPYPQPGQQQPQQPPQPYPYPPQPYPQQQPPQPYPQQPYPYPYPHPQPYPYPQPAYPQPTAPPPEPEVVAERLVVEPIYPLIAGGIISFTLAYAVPLIVAGAQGFDNGSEWLGIPVFGPFVTIGKREWGNCPDPDFCNDSLVGAGLAMSAIFQAAGVAMFIPGVAIQRTKIEKVYAIAPLVTDDAAGLSVTGTF